jgi:hypothetical protein
MGSLFGARLCLIVDNCCKETAPNMLNAVLNQLLNIQIFDLTDLQGQGHHNVKFTS